MASQAAAKLQRMVRSEGGMEGNQHLSASYLTGLSRGALAGPYPSHSHRVRDRQRQMPDRYVKLQLTVVS
jgi:hypothetical protein